LFRVLRTYNLFDAILRQTWQRGNVQPERRQPTSPSLLMAMWASRLSRLFEKLFAKSMQRRVQRQDIRPTPKEGHSVNWQAKEGELRWLGVSTE
jgi:hypothetical protein